MLQAVAFGVHGVLIPAVHAAGHEAVAPALRAPLRRLANILDLALLDDGDELDLQAAVGRLQIDDLVTLRVWTPRLGHAARPPRPLAFRWLANRWGFRPSECLYVAGRTDLEAAARRAGWCVMSSKGLDVDSLADRLEDGARPWET